VIVPWSEWAPGHARLTKDPNVSQRHLGLRKACGMHALGEPHHHHLDSGVLRITDYHPRRVARARQAASHNSNDDDHHYHNHNAGVGGCGCGCSGTGDGEDDNPAKEGEGGRERERCERRPSDHASNGALPWHSCVPIPYVEKDIPLPDGLRSSHARCVLGEDVVLLFEVCPTSPSQPIQ